MGKKLSEQQVVTKYSIQKDDLQKWFKQGLKHTVSSVGSYEIDIDDIKEFIKTSKHRKRVVKK